MNEKYWYVHGEAHDLNEFVEDHPGGKQQLMNLRGKDCTEMVYYMHASVQVENIKKILSKYKVNGEKHQTDSDIFTWNKDGLYSVLTQRVKEHFNSQKINRKADIWFWVFLIIQIVIDLAFYYQWIFCRSYVSPIITGLLTSSMAFMIFHTGGHCGLSYNPKINYFLFKFYANYVIGFFDKIWEFHHNYTHHSYTSIHKKDPDLSNSRSFSRKSELQTYLPQHSYQIYSSYVLLVFLPNQWLGQVIQYSLAIKKQKLFGAKMSEKDSNQLQTAITYLILCLVFISILMIKQGIVFSIITLYIYSTSRGFCYWACVFPNHDTGLSETSSIEMAQSHDWGEHQIRHSSNFKAPDVFSHLIGGMNYQIEHHLFPAIHPRHYPFISTIVQEECQKRNIPYNSHSSWFDALKGNYNLLLKTSKPK